MALSNPESSQEISNLACFARIIFSPCTDTLREVLTHQITLHDLKTKFDYFVRNSNIHFSFFGILNQLLFVSSENYSEFDISSLYFFLRWICGVPQHDNKWGHFPCEKDRSMSANIERIYAFRKKYRGFHHSLKDSTFEQEWKQIFIIVKELEECIGLSTENQDAVKKLKNCSLDLDVQKVYIEKLQGEDLF